jgi:DNA-directed RNA polymerase subunit RPC12/RpoP
MSRKRLSRKKYDVVECDYCGTKMLLRTNIGPYICMKCGEVLSLNDAHNILREKKLERILNDKV